MKRLLKFLRPRVVPGGKIQSWAGGKFGVKYDPSSNTVMGLKDSKAGQGRALK